MEKVITFLISGYIGGIIGQFIYLNFFHHLAKHSGTMFNIGLSLVWAIGKAPTPWWVWGMAIVAVVLSVIGSKQQ